MRNFDNYEQIHDNEGNLLVGKLVFCRKGTTEQEPIYAWDSEHNEYVAINPEVLININGRPDQQIFLSDVDYTIYVFKYIGNGEMDQDSDQDNWLAQYSFNNLYLTFGVDIKSDSPFLVANMAELEATDPANVGITAGKTLVCLGGYNALGDCPPVYYVWDQTSTKTANGVDVVAVTGISVGRWLLVNTFTEIGFDVRHAGCFAEKTAAETSINQSYAIQRADTYALKYGLKIVFPDLFSDTYSYYLLTNLIVNSEVVADDGVKLLTATSATLNFVSEENLKKKVPFILHDGTYSGYWSVKGETIRTGYFENNQTLTDTNWPPTITATKKYIYDAYLKCNTLYIFNLSNIEVAFYSSLTANEVFELTNCKIESQKKINRMCFFTNCEIKGSFFASSLTPSDIYGNAFLNCVSSLDSWDSVDKYVMFKVKQGDSDIDLQGKNCTIDFTSYPFPFSEISNARFSGNTKLPIDKNGNKLVGFRLHNVFLDHLKISQNTDLLLFECYNSSVRFELVSSGHIPNAIFAATDSFFYGDILVSKEFRLYHCEFSNGFSNETTSATAKAIVENCELSGIGATLFSQSTFNIIFTNNILKNSARLALYGSSSNQTFVDTIISNNSVVDGPREFVQNNVISWNLSSIGNYEYRNNVGTEKPDESIKLMLRIPWYSYGATIPSGKKRYLQQDSNNSNACNLHGVKIKDLFFSFGENTTNDILVRTDPISTISDYSMLYEFSSSGTFVNSNTYDNVAGAFASALYRKGQSSTKEILDGTYTSDKVIVYNTGMTDGDLCDVVLLVDKVHYANATGEILK